MKLDHETHRWKPHLPDALAYFSKREDEAMDDAIWLKGRVLACNRPFCPAFLFVPHNDALSPVEAVLVSITNSKEAA